MAAQKKRQQGHMGEAVSSTFKVLGKEMGGGGGEQPTRGTVDRAYVEAIIEPWADTPKQVARRTMDKYGPPNEATESRLIWYRNGP